MPPVLIVSPRASAGKTTIAAGLAKRVRATGTTVALKRLGEDAGAVTDAATFAAMGLSESADVVISEAAAGDLSALGAASGARIVVVDAGGAVEEVADYSAQQGESLAGVIVNRVPERRTEAMRGSLRAVGIEPLALVPEDRLLAAPTLGQIVSALNAQVQFLNGHQGVTVDKPVIASISADPGQGYFSRYDARTVIVRSDKPDLQLAALNAGAGCLIITGTMPLLSYVLDRAEDDETPLVQTRLDTVSTVREVESLFGAGAFSGGESKVNRVAELLSAMDLAALASD